MKKVLCVFLSLLLAMSFAGQISFAAEETVFFSDDFSNLTEGKAPSVSSTDLSAWSKLTINESKKLLVLGATDGDNKVLSFQCASDGTAGAPRIAKYLDVSKLTNLTISYKIQPNGRTLSFQYVSDGAAKGMTTYLAQTTSKKWTDVVVKINFKQNSFTTTENGKVIEKNQQLHIPNDKSTVEFRFMAGLDLDTCMLMDDVKFSTTDSADVIATLVKKSSTSSDTAKATTEKKVHPETLLNKPNPMADIDKNKIIIKEDFEKYKDKTKRTAIKSLSGGTTACVRTLANGDNMTLTFYSDDGVSHGPRVEFAIPVKKLKKVNIDFAVKPSDSNLFFKLYGDGNESGSANFAIIEADGKKISKVDWNYVHMEVDLAQGRYSGNINGDSTFFGNESLIQVHDSSTAVFRLGCNIGADDTVYIDNLLVYSDNEVKYEGMLRGQNEVEWANVLPQKPISSSSFVNNLTEHPRILVHSWEKLQQKVNLTNETKTWYNNLMKVANECLTTNPMEHVVNNRGNILESSRGERARLQALAFAYGMTKDKKYADKAYAEMITCGSWPDWSAFKSTLVTAELLWAYACAYDWCYDAYDDEQRSELFEIMREKALADYVYNYEGQSTNENFTTSSINWNPVCNSSAIAAAFAFADEQPEIAEYLLEKAPVFITNALPPYSPDGAFPEGVSYWDYGTTFLTFAMDYLENGFREGYKLPDNYYYINSPGLADTCDFPIYMCGTTGRFRYGDCADGMTSCSALYWYANKFNKPQYAWYENNAQYRDGFFKDYDAIASLCWYDPNNTTVKPGTFGLDKVYDRGTGFQGFSFRSGWEGNRALVAMLQAGYNKNNHSYMSVGTYAIDFHNKKFVAVTTGHDYSITESKDKVYYKRGEGSNTIICNPGPGADQISDAMAQVIAHGESDSTAFGILDLTPVNKDYVSAKRGIMLTDNRRRVLIQDEATTSKPSEFYWFANTDAAISISPDKKSAILEIDGERMLARIIEGPSDAEFTIMPRKSLIEGVLNTVGDGNKLAIHMTNVTDLKLCVEYTGLEKGEGIPEKLAFVPLSEWRAENGEKRTVSKVGDATVLKINSPNAYAGGDKTYVDPDNTDVVPVIINDRTLVPVRFISESFGADVGWDAASRCASVNYRGKQIKLTLDSDKMIVDDGEVTLDVPAQVINDRTFIPLRALVEALGKNVFWDNRGLIIISDYDISLGEDTLCEVISDLDIRIKMNGEEFKTFDIDRDTYYFDLNEGAAKPSVEAYAIGAESVSVENGEDTILTYTDISGKQRKYTFKFNKNAFENVKSTNDKGMLSSIKVNVETKPAPSYNTFIYVEDLLDSTGFETYPKRGIVDGVINSETQNRWAVNGNGWIQMDFGEKKNVYSMAFAGVSMDSRAYSFDVLASDDGENWTMVKEKYTVQTTAAKMAIIDLNTSARYIKLVGHGNSTNTWNTWAEVRFYESAAQQAEDMSYWDTYFGSSGISGKAGESKKIDIVGVDSTKETFTLPENAVVTYKMTDTSIATVDESGNVSFISKGKTQLDVTVSVDGVVKSASFDVTVE